MFRCTSFALPPEAEVRRESTRPLEFRGPDFEKEFDSCTLFYDLILVAEGDGKSLVFVGPPFLNLFTSFCRARICGQHLGSTVSSFYFRDRCCDVWIANWNSDVVQLEFHFGSYRLTPQTSANHLYRGKRVLYTLSKDNEVRWIVDWVRFHVRNHGANGVLIYDNASTRYTAGHLEESLKEVFPDIEVNVVNWPYKYGPQGFSKDSWWDSDFCQSGAFQDARLRFLSVASSVLNCDVDEFVLSATGQGIFEATERSRSGCTMFAGRWISNATSPAQPSPDSRHEFRHSDFRFLERTQTEICPGKWCVVPQRSRPEEQWRTHVLWGKDPASCSFNAFSYRHFRGISTDWKYRRYQPIKGDPGLHQFDGALNTAFVRAGMIRPVRKVRVSLPHLLQQITRSRRMKPVELRPLAVDPSDPALGGNMIGGDPNTYHPALWSFLAERFSVKSILDVGCGEGHCVQYFLKLGVRAFGFDALKRNVEQAVVPVALHDLRWGPFKMSADLVHCCEVVEHIDEEYLPNLLETFSNGRVIAMTHALPGQTGYHHVNCQPSGYWIAKLKAFGYKFLSKETEEGKYRIKASGKWTYFLQSGLIFERQ